MLTVRGNQIVTGWLFPGTYLLKTLSVHSFKSLRQRSYLKLWLHFRLARLTVFCEIDAKLRNHHIIRISNVQLILRNHFSLLSGFPLFCWFCEIEKSVQFTVRMSTVQLILWNCEIAKSIQFTIRISNVQLILRNHEIAKSVQFAKITLHRRLWADLWKLLRFHFSRTPSSVSYLCTKCGLYHICNKKIHDAHAKSW